MAKNWLTERGIISAKVPLMGGRARCDQARRFVAAGIDPGKQRKSEKLQRKREREAQALADAGLPVACAMRV